MNGLVIAIFVAVYGGMLLGRWPGLQLDRTGVALLGAMALVGTGAVESGRAWAAVDIPTIALLFALMVVSVQLRLGGFYTRVTELLHRGELSPARLLFVLVVFAGGLAAVFTNDIICLAMAPVLLDLCRRRGLNPVPFLLALACAANVGSAATLIGNPQNILVGQRLGLSFTGYLGEALLPTALGLVATWGIIALQFRRRWQAELVTGPCSVELPHFDAWQTGKGLLVTFALLAVFLGSWWPRELAALTGAALLLLSRQLHSRQMLGLVDWQLLVLFIGLFVVNHAFEETGLAARAVVAAADRGMDLQHPGGLLVVTVLLSNAVSNVPAVMLLLPHVPEGGGVTLALISTFAGNLLVVGSIANIIVVDIARRSGVPIDWRVHARTGVPVTLVTVVIVALFLALRG